jgi:predicted DNA-binding transcriptional regulator AlpA
VDVDDLVGATEIGQRLGIDRRSVHQLRRRHADFPEPITRLESAMVWAWPDVERWAKATGRLQA